MLQDLNHNLEKVRKLKFKRSIIRSKVRLMEKGEIPNEYFPNLENHNFKNLSIDK